MQFQEHIKVVSEAWFAFNPMIKPVTVQEFDGFIEIKFVQGLFKTTYSFEEQDNDVFKSDGILVTVETFENDVWTSTHYVHHIDSLRSYLANSIINLDE